MSPLPLLSSDIVAESHFGNTVSRAAQSGLLPGVAVVICTYKRAQRLETLLHSLAEQTRLPDELIIVDASPDRETEQVFERLALTLSRSIVCSYFRVCGSLAGLTRQRNFALTVIRHQLIAFFDDDVVLDPACLAEMESVYRQQPGVIGVGAFIQNQFRTPTRIWKLRRLLGVVPTLTPGRYMNSGVSTPWTFQPPTVELIAADWLSGCAMMWDGAAARELGFYDPFEGYAMGEDLEFSLRARLRGALFLAGKARVKHFHDPAGRPEQYRLGYMQVRNGWEIHRRALLRPRRRYTAWFCYAQLLDGILAMRDLLYPERMSGTVRNLRGRARAASDILRSQQKHR